MECENNTKKNFRTKKIQQPCATPYRCAEATAILGDCSDRSRDFGRGCAHRVRTLCNNSESDPSKNPENLRRFRTTLVVASLERDFGISAIISDFRFRFQRESRLTLAQQHGGRGG